MPPLVLSDSDDTGLEVDCKALLVASDAGTVGGFFYADADRGGSDVPLDGEFGLGDDEVLISGVRRRTATILQLNDDNNPAALDIGAYFSTGGAGDDLTIYLQTSNDGEVSFPASNVNFSRDSQVRFTLPADAQTLLDNLADGDRWIFKLARPESTAVPVALEGQSLGLELDIARADVVVTTVSDVVLQGQPLGIELDVSRARIRRRTRRQRRNGGGGYSPRPSAWPGIRRIESQRIGKTAQARSPHGCTNTRTPRTP